MKKCSDIEGSLTKKRADKTKLADQFGRKISYLRVSVTDRCNLRCFYCQPYDISDVLPHKEILSYEEMYRLIEIAVNLGIRKVRITGGEPLVRKDLLGFIEKLCKINGLEDISLTTNGIYLKKHIERLYLSGIHRINISMDTLQKNRYRQITGVDGFQEVWDAITLAEKINFKPIKINMVVIKGVNDDEVQEMALLSQSYPYHIRFIEYMPFGVKNQHARDYFVPNSWVNNQLVKLGRLLPIPKSTHDGPADRYKFEGALGEVGFISAISNHFCGTCNKLRLTANGNLKPCLISNIKENIKDPMRSGASDDELASIFIKAINSKPREHKMNSQKNNFILDHMCKIGG
jgi:cyclic pyranopterin phosphate synthase